MESILVTPENLRKKAGDVEDKASDYYKHYNSLLQDVRDMTEKDWTGEDATEFRNKVEGFEPDFTKMKELMEEYAQFLRDAAKKYEDTQTNVKGNLKGLR